MTDPLHLPSLDIGHRVDAPLLVLDLEVRSTANGDPYTMLTLGNASGRIGTEPFWRERQDDVAGLRRGHVVHVVGEVGTFRDKRQLRVSSIRAVPPGAADPAAFLPTVGPVDKYWKTLDGWRHEIAAPRLRAVLDLFFEDEQFRARFEACPAAVQGHHAAVGGLLKHTTEVAAIARTVARACGADPELTLAGALLHDIGKLESYTWDGLFAFTDRGRLVGHVVLGTLMLEEAIAVADPAPCTGFERDLLLHLILSHHGHLEFGSPVTPMTLEAEILYWSDNASAKTASMADVLQDDESFPDGLVSTAQWTLDRRRAYRGRSDWGRAGSD
jgi:3'-5' exoribonuclease